MNTFTEKEQKTYFISDYHFSHNLIASLRGFRNIDAMNSELIAKHNATVSKDGIVYHLGDFCWDNDYNKFLKLLNGEFIFLWGNHDSGLHNVSNRVIRGFFEFKLANSQTSITLCHYPMRVWNKSHFNSWHIYGHIHRTTDFGGKTLNVSWESIGSPISLPALASYMDTREDNWDFIPENQRGK